MEFNLAWYLKGYQVHDGKDFREMQWMFERLKEKIKEENDSGHGMQEQFRNLTGSG